MNQLQNACRAPPSKTQWSPERGPTIPRPGEDRPAQCPGLSPAALLLLQQRVVRSRCSGTRASARALCPRHLLQAKLLPGSRHPEKYFTAYLFGYYSPKSSTRKTPWQIGILTEFIQSLEAFQAAKGFLPKITDT